MKLIHTSPAEITEISNTGLFGDCLFFSASEYSMGSVEAVYNIDIQGEKIIEVEDLEDDETVDHISSVLSVSKDDAIDLLCGDEQAGVLTGDFEDDWFIQAQQGYVAKKMGYEAVLSNDEQGAVYIVPMFGRESDLVRVA